MAKEIGKPMYQKKFGYDVSLRPEAPSVQTLGEGEGSEESARLGRGIRLLLLHFFRRGTLSGNPGSFGGKSRDRRVTLKEKVSCL